MIRDTQSVRVRFAPSPTGPLHIGGVRTALYNYLFARKHEGAFILRIEDTDQARYIPGAEDYIRESLEWLGLKPDEGPGYGGDHGPYRQSERKSKYKMYAQLLVEKGHAYYAFDTPEELEKMRQEEEARGNYSPKYDHKVRDRMKNSLTLEEDRVKACLDAGDNVTIRLKITPGEEVVFQDTVRGTVRFSSDELDDKVILKADGMPTYHLANIVDDHLMEISHVIRGEEWLSSTAHHVLMYRSFDWSPPVFVHLPLILKPTGKGKLSKRDGAKFGFPVFPLEWIREERYHGFREEGFNPNALLNFLAFLGWSPGTEQEIFTLQELIEVFDIHNIVKSGARFDIDKARWYNQQYLISMSGEDILEGLMAAGPKDILENTDKNFLVKFADLMKERVHTYTEFVPEGLYFFKPPDTYDDKQIKKRYRPELRKHFETLKALIDQLESFNARILQDTVKHYLIENDLKIGVFFPLLRIMVCGSLKGPDLFSLIELLGKNAFLSRWDAALAYFEGIISE